MSTREQYTITETATGFILNNITNGSDLLIEPGHQRYDWILKNLGRIINITETGRWNSQKDYNNAYGLNSGGHSVPSLHSTVEVKLTKLDDLSINPDLFIPLRTSSIFDQFVSTEGGILPGANIMAAGAPGVGKTTVLLELLANLHATGKKCLFISAEMNRIDMARYLKRFPGWGQLPILFLSDADGNSQSVIEKTLEEGWDLVLIDSYTEVNDTIKEDTNQSRGKVEKWFLNLMSNHNEGQNAAGRYTTFLTILQLSKGGNFVGSNKLKHMTTAMMSIRWDGGENTGKRYMEFSKNRIGDVGKKLYFSLHDGVQFDEARWKRDLENDKVLRSEIDQLEREEEAFDRIFGLVETELD